MKYKEIWQPIFLISIYRWKFEIILLPRPEIYDIIQYDIDCHLISYTISLQ